MRFLTVAVVFTTAFFHVTRATGDAPLPVLDAATKITMEEAAVTVDLELMDYPGPDAGLPALPWKEVGVKATVVCTFRMRCTEARAQETPFSMAFPVGYLEDPLAAHMNLARLLDFKAEVEGKPLASSLRSWEVPAPDGTKVHYFGHAWQTSIRKDVPLAVKSTYVMYVPFDGTKSGFTYILRSAASWAGILGHETVTMKSGPGLSIDALPAEQLTVTRREDGSLMWEIRNQAPRENAHVTIVKASAAAPGPRR